MSRYSFAHLSDPVLLRSLAEGVARDRASTADLLALIAEVDARKLFLPAGYPSMFLYCVQELRLSEDAAAKRIQAARAARRFPAIFEAVADGRLHLAALVLLAPHLTEHTADDLLAASTYKTKSEIEQLLAEQFPRADVLAWVAAIPAPPAVRSTGEHAPGHVEDQLVPERVGEVLEHAPGHVGDRSRVKPLSPQSFAVQFTLSRCGHDKLRHAQELLGHQVPSGDIAAVFERALDALIPQLEQRRFAATTHPRTGQGRTTEGSRHIPAHVRRAVRERDGGQCMFVSEAGHRCPARTHLEYDHIEAFARGGEATVAGIRLQCRAHNQYGAEQTFGSEFVRHKRIAAAEDRASAKGQATVAVRAESAAAKQADAAEHATAAERAAAAERARELDVVPWLRQLGFSAGEARSAAALCEDMPDASLEQRVRVALSHFRVRGARVVLAACRR